MRRVDYSSAVPHTEELLTVREVAETFRVSRTAVSRWAEEDRLPGFRTPGGRWRFRREDVERFLNGKGDAA